MKYYNTTEAAKKLKLSDRMVRNYCERGELGERIGRNWAITQAEITRFRKIPRKLGRPTVN